MTMQTKTSYTITLSAEDTAQAITAYLRNREVPVPDKPDDIRIKWFGKGEAVVSFEQEQAV
jgi:hypothetical protein